MTPSTPGPLRIVDVGGSHELVTLEVMRRKGYLEELGVRAAKSYVTNGAEAVDLLRTGQGDVAMQVGFGPALVAIEQGAPLKVIAAANLLTVHAVYSKDPQIRRLQDLAGRSVGVGKLGALTHQLMFAALRKQGIDPASVKFVPIGSSVNIFRALLAGQVEAGFGETEVFEHQAEYGVHALQGGVLWEELPEFPNQASFATAAAIASRRGELVRALAAYLLLYRYLQRADSWDTYASAWTAARPDSNLAEARVQWMFYQRHQPFAEDLRLPESQLAYMQELNVAMHLQRQVLAFDAVTDMSLAHDALDLVDHGRD